MTFKEELARKIVAGEKTATRRRMSDNCRSPWARGCCGYREGQIFAVQPGRGIPRIADAEVTSVYAQRLGTMGDPDARREGFSGMREFALYWEALHGHFDLRERVWVVEFKLLESASVR